MQQPDSRITSGNREDVSDYPQFPRVEPDNRRVTVRFNGEIIADSTSTHRVLEQGLPPAYYIPPEDVSVEYLRANQQQTWCEHKGDAHYYDIVVDDHMSESAAWCYPEPKEGFQPIQYAIAFYPNRVDTCSVDGEEVEIIGDDSGGWVTSEVTGPFRDTAGTDRR